MALDLLADIEAHIEAAAKRYGAFASTHEAMGVALEEWTEFQDAVRANDLNKIEEECIDLAAVFLRLARSIRRSDPLRLRSVK